MYLLLFIIGNRVMSFETTQKFYSNTESNDMIQNSKVSNTTSPHVYITDKKFISKIINNFINDEIDTNNAIHNSPNNQHCFNRNEIIKALTNMQLSYRSEYVSGQKVNINTSHFKSALLNSMAKLNNVAIPKNLNQLDARTIDFVEMIFGAFLRDKNISDDVKNLLLKLQIPVIKTSMLDKNFFYNDQHPARHVLNTIAHLGIGIENSNNTIYKTVELIIEQLLRSFDIKMLSFSTALASLSRLTKIEDKKHQQNECITKKQTMQELARQTVLTELQFYTMDVNLPKPVQPLILNHWSTLMFHRYIQYGKNSKKWLEASGILQRLTYSFSPITNKEEWLSLKCSYAGIVNKVKTLLEETNQNKEKLFLAIRNLNKTYEKLLEKHNVFHDDAVNMLLTGEAGEESISIDHIGLREGPNDKAEKLAKSIVKELPDYVRPNTWFKVFTGTGTSVRRLKLSVIIIEKAQLIFVDRKGSKIIEKDASQFIKELENKHSCLISDHSVFDYALSQVIGNIARTKY